MSLFDVSHRLFGRFKREDAIQHRAYGAHLDERGDLSQLIPACSHEEKGIIDLMTLGLSSDPEAQKTHHQLEYPAQSKLPRKLGIRWTGDRDEISTGFERSEGLTERLC